MTGLLLRQAAGSGDGTGRRDLAPRAAMTKKAAYQWLRRWRTAGASAWAAFPVRDDLPADLRRQKAPPGAAKIRSTIGRPTKKGVQHTAPYSGPRGMLINPQGPKMRPHFLAEFPGKSETDGDMALEPDAAQNGVRGQTPPRRQH